MAERWSVVVGVVVSGQPTTVRAVRLRSIDVLIRDALNEAGIDPALAPAWECRDADGRLLENAVLVKDYGIREGQILYVNARVGVNA